MVDLNARAVRFTERVELLECQRHLLYERQGGKCEHCGRWYSHHSSMALAHRLSDSKPNRRKYGVGVVDHWRNKALVCRETHLGVDCNSAMLVDGKPATAAALVREIRTDMERGGV